MLKRKYSNYKGWKRIIKKRYSQTLVNSNEFLGYATLNHLIEVKEPLTKKYGNRDVTIVDNGYMWLHQIPFEAHHSVTTMFNSNGEIVQWYIDICLQNGTENNVPWIDDLFLDIVVLPSGEIIHLDKEELEDALENGVITEKQYVLAWNEVNKLTEQIKNDNFILMKLAAKHKELLARKLG